MPHIVALLTNPFLQRLLKPAHVTQGIISDALVSHMKTNEFFTSKRLVFKGRSATFQLLNVLTNGLNCWMLAYLLTFFTLISRKHLIMSHISLY